MEKFFNLRLMTSEVKILRDTVLGEMDNLIEDVQDGDKDAQGVYETLSAIQEELERLLKLHTKKINE